MKISYNELFQILEEILIEYGISEPEARLCATVFSENTLAGVASHGVNRFPDFIKMVKSGYIVPTAKPTLVESFNALEKWDGNYGPGPSNAAFITSRTIELAKKFGIGCVALKNTHHWMRPGYYAWHAADQGYVFICWTNTIPIMPPWGAKTPTTGNNPIVFGVPRKEGHIVLDMALSQFSYGKLAAYALENKELPYDGGYDSDGNLTKNAGEINKSLRPLPIGYWKGAGLSLLLDLIATILSGGKSTFDLSQEDVETGVSQVYIAIDPEKFSSAEIVDRAVNDILNYYLSAEKIGSEGLSYPGERILKRKSDNTENGIRINDKIWQKINELR